MNSAFSHGQSRRPPARPAVQPTAVAKLPRVLLLALCLAYVLPGFVGRDPWRSDGLSFVVMVQMAKGHLDWLHPVLYGRSIGEGWLGYWMGAVSLKVFAPLLGPVLATRLPFIVALGASLMLTWYASYHFARNDCAQPVPPAFGPPIVPVDYARAIADGALLTLIACFGLLQRGHEATAQVLQLAAVAGVLYGAAAQPLRPRKGAVALGIALLVLALSGAAGLALMLAALLMVNTLWQQRRLPVGVLVALALGTAVAVAIESAQGWPMPGRFPDIHTLGDFFRLALWFTWPAWPLALWAAWRWRESLGARHLQLSWMLSLLALAAALALQNADRVFLLSLPPLAVLGGFALPVLRRGALAAIDWFAVIFFSLFAVVVWLLWLALMTGWPAKPAANIARLAPGFVPSWDFVALAVALLGTAVWGAVVAWRTGRHRHPLWKGMVLSASGVTLIWLLVATLWLPVLNYASTYRGMGQQLRAAAAAAVPETVAAQHPACVLAERVDLTTLAMLGYWSRLRLVASPALGRDCPLALDPSPPRDGSRWQVLWSGSRPGERDERLQLYRREPAAP